MSEEVVRLYVAEIAMAVDYLHSKRIVHRCVQLPPCNPEQSKLTMLVI